MPLPKFFESAVGASFHLAAGGGVIMGKIFDQVINGQTPNLTLNGAAFAANSGISKVYGVAGGVATDITSNFRIVSTRFNVSGNNSTVYVDFGFTSPVTYDGFMFELDASDYTKSTPIFEIFDAYFTILTNTATMANNSLCHIKSGLFTGTYAGVSVTNAMIVYSSNSVAVNSLRGIFTSKYSAIA